MHDFRLRLNSAPILLDLNQPIDSCSAQDLMAALMLQRYVPYADPQITRATMERVLLDLNAYPYLWQSFVMRTALPTTDWWYASGALLSLRDLGLGWNADTLYILSPDIDAAEGVQLLASGWDCTEITTYSAKQTQYLSSCLKDGVLTAARWRSSAEPSRKTDYVSVYSSAPPIVFNQPLPLGECYAQTLMAALMMRGEVGRFQPQRVLEDLHAHRSTWRSFMMDSGLPEFGADLQASLDSMAWLPQEWGGNYFYVWAWDVADAMYLQSLRDRWQCDEVWVIDGIEADQLLNLPNAAPLVIFAWWDVD